DNNDCITNDTIIIGEPGALAITYLTTEATCSASDGAIDITIAGGTIPYQYLWSTTETTEDISGLPAGIYSVSVADNNNCEINETIIVNNAGAPAIDTIIITDLLCNSVAQGSIDIAVSGGTFPYFFVWSNSETTEDINNLFAGIYSVTVSDAASCNVFGIAEITEPAPLIANVVGTNVTCNGINDGFADLTVTGGTLPYGFFWSYNGATTEDNDSLPAGIYNVTVTDANGCQAIGSATVTQPTALTISSVVTDVSCNGGNDGEITFTASGGTATYSYSPAQTLDTLTAGTYYVTVTDVNSCTAVIVGGVEVTEPAVLTVSSVVTNVNCNGGNDGAITFTATGGTAPYSYAPAQILNTLIAGNYTVTVTDTLGCQVIESADVTEPSLLTVSSVVTDVSCNGDNDGAITFTASGGTAPYTYNPDSIFTNITAGTYNVTVTDFNGCTATATATVTEPAALTATITAQTNVSCNGGSNGTANLTLSGGTPGYNYIWNTGQTSQDLINIPAGIYCVTVSDANLCTATVCVTITQPSALTVSSVVTDVSCNGGNDGEITFTASGATPPYTYNPGSSFTNLTAGTYSVTVSDVNGCITIDSATIAEPGAIVADIIGTNVLCNGDNTGSADLTVTGGSIPYTYEWDNGEITQDIDSLTADIYNVTITDDYGCTAIASVTIAEPSALIVNIISTNVSCNGNCDGYIFPIVSGGTAPYMFEWATGQSSADITELCSGEYCVTITDAVGCLITECVTITEPAPLDITIFGSDVLCNGDSTGSADLTVTGGNVPYTYYWDNGETTEDIYDLSAGVYSVTILDDAGCPAVSSVTISEPAPLSILIISTDDTGPCDGTATASVSGGTPSYSYLWDDPLFQTTATATTLCFGLYNVTVTDANGCTETDTVYIDAVNIMNISAKAPVAIYPNPTNGKLNIVNADNTVISLYNAIGELIIKVNNVSSYQTIDMTKLPDGNYVIRVLSNDRIITRKISLQK
ncbi:MAG: T9SS type A sorting domain-containing protein, partial [Bacteroidia bacterium]|nr:T9SS type A sorting domain-containing protein [Bacteroidia bacterium]